MYILKNCNVVKITDNEFKKDKLISEGYILQDIVTETMQKPSNNVNNSDVNVAKTMVNVAETMVNVNNNQETKTKTKTETKTKTINYKILRKPELIKYATSLGIDCTSCAKSEIYKLIEDKTKNV